MIQFLAFDLDGTLIDSIGDIAAAGNQALSHWNEPPKPFAVYRSLIGQGSAQLMKDLVPHRTDPDFFVQLNRRFLEIYGSQKNAHTTIYPGAESFLENWTQQGGQIGLITNKSAQATANVLAEFKLDRFPWLRVFTAESLPERKPSPVPLQMLLQIAGLRNEQALMVGDGVPDFQSAQAAGVRHIAVAFGYSDLTTIQDYNPAAILEDYRDLQKLIRSL